MQDRMTRIEEKVDTVVSTLKDLSEKFDNLDARYITRREYDAIQ